MAKKSAPDPERHKHLAQVLRRRARENEKAVPGYSDTPPPTDLPSLIAFLTARTDHPRMDKALKMLKVSRFQLFAEVNAQCLVGVVRSQREDNLVYSCYMTSTGGFCCCTHELGECLGMRGAPCKHLLVLLIGLAQAGKMDYATIYDWIDGEDVKQLSVARNTEKLGETLLRYKAAEAGQVDWRPTETIPEDYYAL